MTAEPIQDELFDLADTTSVPAGVVAIVTDAPALAELHRAMFAIARLGRGCRTRRISDALVAAGADREEVAAIDAAHLDAIAAWRRFYDRIDGLGLTPAEAGRLGFTFDLEAGR